MKKEIYFCVDDISASKFAVKGIGLNYTYDGTEQEIKRGTNRIATTSLAHLTFDVINMGHDVYLCYNDKKVKIEEGMQLSETGYSLSESYYCEDADIFDIFRSGFFDKRLGYNTGR